MVDGRDADVVELTFETVGDTPDNKYDVYIAQDTGLVEQWDFYSTAADAAPRFQVPWHDWTRHGRIMLSGNRGRGQLTDIGVYSTLPASVFTDPGPVDWSRHTPTPGTSICPPFHPKR